MLIQFYLVQRHFQFCDTSYAFLFNRHFLYISLTIITLMIIPLIPNSLYIPEGVYSEIYPTLEGNTEEFNFNISSLRMIYLLIQGR